MQCNTVYSGVVYQLSARWCNSTVHGVYQLNLIWYCTCEVVLYHCSCEMVLYHIIVPLGWYCATVPVGWYCTTLLSDGGAPLQNELELYLQDGGVVMNHSIIRWYSTTPI